MTPHEPAKILLVDDEPNNLLALKAVLEPLGHLLIEADSGEAALRKLLNQDFAVILLDVAMPDLNGFETAEMIRNRNRCQTTPIIFLTAFGKDEPRIQKGYSLGAVDYLFKPFDPNILRAKVQVFVNLFNRTEEIRRQAVEIEKLHRQRQIDEERAAHQQQLLEKEREATLALEKKAAELERSNAELDQFAYAASHDLQEPLRKIRAFADRLNAKYADSLPETAQDYLRRMTAGAGRMQAMITALLTYSRVIRREEPFVQIDLSKLAREVISDMQVTIERSRASVEVEDNLPTIEADPVQLQQLLQNLIGNAIKFRRPDVSPEVKVRGSLLPDTPAEQPKRIELLVEDNGIGFDEKYLDRIFQPFQRLHSRDEYGGSGIGLAVCRKVVERHHGGLTARSTLGSGATFVVTLPVRQVPDLNVSADREPEQKVTRRN